MQKNLHSGTTAGLAVLPLQSIPRYQVHARAQLQRYHSGYRSCQAWRYYRCTAGSTAGTLRKITKESSGSTRHVPLRYRRVFCEQNLFAGTTKVLPLPEARGTLRYHRWRVVRWAAGLPLQVERYYHCTSGTTARQVNSMWF